MLAGKNDRGEYVLNSYHSSVVYMYKNMNQLIFILYGLFITFVSLRPSVAASGLEHSDKAMHFIAYAVFTVLGYRAVKQPQYFMYVCIAIVAYSGAMELAQSFMPNRFMSIYDLLANTLGVTFSYVLCKNHKNC